MCGKNSRQWEMAAIRTAVGAYFRLRFGFTADKFRERKGPYLLLCNHVTDYDPFFLTVAAGQPPRFVASDHVLRQGLLTKLATRYSSMIIHRKGAGTGMRSAMEILKALKAGERVGLFPEGNRSFNGVTGDIPAVTGKLARGAGVPVITYRLEGGYFTQPRWGFGFRRGKLRGRLVHVYEPEELAAMTNEEMLGHIKEDLYEDAFAAQKTAPVKYKCKAPAEGLEAAVFACPSCGAFSSLTSSGDTLSCACGYSLKMDAYGFLKEKEGAERTVTELDTLQREALRKRMAENEGSLPLWQDAVPVQTIENEHDVVKTEEVTLTAYPDRIEVNGRAVTAEEITGLAITARNTLNVFLSSGEQYEIAGPRSFNGLKYIYWYRIHRKETLF